MNPTIDDESVSEEKEEDGGDEEKKTHIMSKETHERKEYQVNRQRHCYDSSGMHMFLMSEKVFIKQLISYSLSLIRPCDKICICIHVYIHLRSFFGMIIDDGNRQIRN